VKVSQNGFVRETQQYLSVKTAAILDLSGKPSRICLLKQQQFWIFLGNPAEFVC